LIKNGLNRNATPWKSPLAVLSRITATDRELGQPEITPPPDGSEKEGTSKNLDRGS
jgi:hypothetical protein